MKYNPNDKPMTITKNDLMVALEKAFDYGVSYSKEAILEMPYNDNILHKVSNKLEDTICHNGGAMNDCFSTAFATQLQEQQKLLLAFFEPFED